MVRRAVARLLSVLWLTVGIGLSQVPAHYIEIHLPSRVSSESVFIRYILAGEELGGWVQPHPGVSAYIISTTRADGSAAGIKAVLYAPGCAMQTLDMPPSNSNNPQYSFTCQPLGNAGIDGRLIERERLSGHEVKLQARYIARWAQPFLGLGNIVVSIPVGDVVDLAVDGRFRLAVPDLARDPLAGAAGRPGEIQIWARDKDSGDDVAQLFPAGNETIKTRMSGLKLQSNYAAEIVFAPCSLKPPLVLIHREGFAQRPDPCER